MAPYPGQLTSIVNCGKKYLPKLLVEEEFSIISAYTNTRFALSICDEDELAYHYSQAFFWNKKNSSLVIVEYFQKNRNLPEPAFVFLKTTFLLLEKIDTSQFSAILK
jgi:hypothetical protein